MLDGNSVLNAMFNHGFAYWIYGVMSILAALFVWRFVPETKGHRLEAIQHLWTEHPGPRTAEPASRPVRKRALIYLSVIDYCPSSGRLARRRARRPHRRRRGPYAGRRSRGRVRDVAQCADRRGAAEQWTATVPPGDDLGPLEQLPLSRRFDGAATSSRLLAPFDLQ